VREEVQGVSVLRLDDYTPRDQRQSRRHDSHQPSILDWSACEYRFQWGEYDHEDSNLPCCFGHQSQRASSTRHADNSRNACARLFSGDFFESPQQRFSFCAIEKIEMLQLSETCRSRESVERMSPRPIGRRAS
jgi:hypothetical protein